MTATAAGSSAEVIECLINAKHATASSGKRRPWWLGLTLDQQDEALERIDPQRYGAGERPPMPVGKWNREKRRVSRARLRWIEEIRALRKPCHCDNCRRNHRPPFPRYYVVCGVSYECWLEQHVDDPELADDLAALRNDRTRAGAALISREHIDER